METEKIAKEVGHKILNPIGKLQALALLVILISPIIWIWFGWSLTWKIALTAFICMLILALFYNVIKKAFVQAVNDSLSGKANHPDSDFHKRVKEVIAKHSAN